MLPCTVHCAENGALDNQLFAKAVLPGAVRLRSLAPAVLCCGLAEALHLSCGGSCAEVDGGITNCN